MQIHDELIADFKAIQKKIEAHRASEEAKAVADRKVRNRLVFQVSGKCDGAIAILENDANECGTGARPEGPSKPVAVRKD